MKDGYNIISGLCQSGLNVAFCDESERSGSPQDGLAPDLRIQCALVMPSEVYAKSKQKLESRLSQLDSDIKEFHSTEIVNPSNNSSWSKIAFEERIGIFEFLAQLVVKSTDKLFYCFISRQQYSEMRKQANTSINMRYEPALKRVFLSKLIAQMASDGKTPAIIMDQDRPLDGLRIEEWSGAESFYEGVVITAPSHLVPGLQLADHAAYSITRYRLKRDNLLIDSGNPFDLHAASTLARLSRRVIHLL